MLRIFCNSLSLLVYTCSFYTTAGHSRHVLILLSPFRLSVQMFIIVYFSKIYNLQLYLPDLFPCTASGFCCPAWGQPIGSACSLTGTYLVSHIASEKYPFISFIPVLPAPAFSEQDKDSWRRIPPVFSVPVREGEIPLLPAASPAVS